MKPVLLLIPGMFNTTAIWDRVVDALNNQGGAPDIRIATRLVEAGTFLPFMGRALLPAIAM